MMKFEMTATFLGCKRMVYEKDDGTKVEYYNVIVDFTDEFRVAKADKRLFDQLSRSKCPQTLRCYYDARFDKFFGRE